MSRCRLLWLMVVLVATGFSLPLAAKSEQLADLLNRELLYYQYKGDGFSAISRYRAALGHGEIAAGQEKWAALAAQLYASWGLFDEAKELYTSPILSRTPQQRAMNWFSLGKAYFDRQHYTEAVAAFEKVGLRQLPKELEYERLLMMGVALYQLDNYAGASSALWSIHPTSKLYPFARINIGMGSIKIGSWPGGISGLSSIKKRIGIDVEADPQFADRLNTVFGYILLYEEYSGSNTAYGKVSMHGFTTPNKKGYRDALEMLKAVSDKGLYANKSLLGQAWIAIDTNELERAREILEGLVKKDPHDLVVQEARLALPYVLEREGDVPRAISRYRSAVSFLDNERNRLDTLLQQLDSGELDNSFLTMRRESAARNPLTAYLPEMLLAPLSHRLLGDFEDINRLRLQLDEWKTRLAGSSSLQAELSRQQVALDDVYLRTVRLLRNQAGE
ncbi:MAG TPA: tetratricopeptide repeat protein, partial [Gammaproteobacteria bacterium]|nr:tetratricopeptide repeat protein [Gammaproteobacteria bacterium]